VAMLHEALRQGIDDALGAAVVFGRYPHEERCDFCDSQPGMALSSGHTSEGRSLPTSQQLVGRLITHWSTDRWLAAFLVCRGLSFEKGIES
jgi:hypothetical protein